MRAAIIAFVLTVLFIAVLRRLAPAAGLIDRPGGRKRHEGEIAVIGGLAMFLGCAGSLALTQVDASTGGLFASVAMLVIVGVLDDRFQLSPWLRLLAQAGAGMVMLRSGIAIQTLEVPGFPAGLDLGWLSAPFTLLLTLTLINAYNMVDGVDGLAAGFGLIALLSLALLAATVAAPTQLPTLLVPICAGLAGFLLFNAPLPFNRSLRCFMGDAGSTLLGLLVCWFGIGLSQHQAGAVHAVTVLWVTALPLMELGSSVIRRVLAGRSPLQADAGHFHHKLRRAGFTAPATCAVLVSIAALFAAIGLVLEYSLTTPAFSATLLAGMSFTTGWFFNQADAWVDRRATATGRVAPSSV